MSREKMSIDDVIKGRRSIRAYKRDNVPEELIRQVIEAATFAPSAKNGQQWRFTVLTGVSKDKFTDLYRSELNKLDYDVGSSYGSCNMMEKAPVTIVVWNTNQFGWATESHSVAAAIQNLLLKAHALGLGTCLNGALVHALDHSPELRAALPIPAQNEIPVGFMIGYPALKFLRTVHRRPARATWL